MSEFILDDRSIRSFDIDENVMVTEQYRHLNRPLNFNIDLYSLKIGIRTGSYITYIKPVGVHSYMDIFALCNTIILMGSEFSFNDRDNIRINLSITEHTLTRGRRTVELLRHNDIVHIISMSVEQNNFINYTTDNNIFYS